MLSETRMKSKGQASLRSAPIHRDVERDPEATIQTTTHALRSHRLSTPLVSLLLVAGCGALGANAAGCGPDGNSPPNPSPDGGLDAGDTDAGAPDAAPPPPVFLDPGDYADLVTIDPKFPFGVAARHAADTDILGSHWGRHGGPMVTTVDANGTPKVVQWAIAGGSKADAAPTARAVTLASDLPSTHFYGADGMVDLPFGPFALLSYSGSGAAFPGEALLYSGSYDEVKSRAKVNGFYSGVGVLNGDQQLIVYSGLSPLSATDSSTSDNGLYAASVCGAALVSAPPCKAPYKVFSWDGLSGPVVADAHSNVFVGASLSSGMTSDAVYGLTKAQVALGSSVNAPALVAVDSMGTSSLAAVAPDGEREGWVLGLGYDSKSTVYAGAFVEHDGALASGSVVLPAAITRAGGVEGLSVFADDSGNPWLAVTTAKSGAYIELRRKAP